MIKFLNEERTRLRLDNVVLDYVQVETPSKDEDGNERYSVTVLVDSDDDDARMFLSELIENVDTFKVKQNVNYPLHDGMEKINDAYKDKIYFTARSAFKPEVCVKDKDGGIVAGKESLLYNGCIANITLTAYVYNAKGKKGVGIGLGNIMFVKDGTRIEHGYNAQIDFAD